MAMSEALRELLGDDVAKIVAERISTIAEPAIEAAVKTVLEERMTALLADAQSFKVMKDGKSVGFSSLDDLIYKSLVREAEAQAVAAIHRALAWRRDMKVEIRLSEEEA